MNEDAAMGESAQPGPTPEAERPEAGGGWGKSAIRASIMLVVSFVVLIVIPDRLIAFLAPRVTPSSRDWLIVAWVTLSFVGLCWLFVVLQRRRR